MIVGFVAIMHGTTLWWLLICLISLQLVTADTHQHGTCSLYGTCGKKSLFGSELPCVDSSPAQVPDDATRSALVDLCGPEYSQGPVCCTADQVETLRENLKRAESLIASCPACKDNFFSLFCRFTCSPDQSTFVNVTRVGQSMSKQPIVLELDHFLDPVFAAGLYDSCKDVKFGATNGYAMDLIGGGAKDYKAFVKFLGDEKPLFGGSPFQMNFPWTVPDPIEPSAPPVRSCSGPDPEFRCACADCPEICPDLPHDSQYAPPPAACTVGGLPCLSFGVVTAYLSIVALLLVGYSGWTVYRIQSERSLEARRLLYDSDDNDTDPDQSVSSDKMRPPYWLNSFFQRQFRAWAFVCAKWPGTVIGSCLLAVLVLSSGLFYGQLETDPVQLWVSPTSREFAEKAHFDNNFGPFYRTQQAYLINDTGPVLSYDTLEWWFDVEERVAALKSESGATLDELCFAPLGPGSPCVVESVTQYFGGDFRQVSKQSWQRKVDACARTPVNCLPPFQQPLSQDLLFGGLPPNISRASEARALIATWVLDNSQDTDTLVTVSDWERQLEHLFVQVQDEAQARGLRVSFSTEMSLEKELNKSTNTDARIVALSYLFMFVYASLALGGVVPGLDRRSLVRSKFSLGLFGIFVVLLSIAAAAGVCCAFGVRATLIIAEVIPFLVLAVGVDNIFLLAHELDNVNRSHPNETVEERVARATGNIGPSILLSASCETLAFALGSSVSMPAVRNFAVYAAVAVFANSVLQMSMFVSALALDQRRVDDGRYDCVPWVSSVAQQPPPPSLPLDLPSSVFDKFDEPTFSKWIRRYYAPYLFTDKVKLTILAVFFAWFTASVALFPTVELGLDQRLAVPSDSYLVDYFSDLYTYFDTGPPVFFVVDQSNSSSRPAQRALCSRFTTCDQFSLTNIIDQERKVPDQSYLVAPAASWIDDFFQWLNPSLDECCLVKKGKSDLLEFCPPGAPSRACEPCFADRPWAANMDGLPEGEDFMRLLHQWLQSPSDPCPLGGRASYGSSVVPDYEAVTVAASAFRSAHKPLKSQQDFIEAYASARRICRLIHDYTGLDVYPYSVFYIFFAQYATIVRDSAALVGWALAVMMLVSCVMLGSLFTALVVTLTVAMIVADVVGVMALWGISLNALSLVNLVICVGIGVEFCIHVARAFTFTHKISASGLVAATRDMRAFNALVGVGGSVFGGIALTKLIGVCVLAFTRSQIFEVYYFRMWLALVVVATAHSFVFLPVMLSYYGGTGYMVAQDSQGLAGDLAARLYDSDSVYQD